MLRGWFLLTWLMAVSVSWHDLPSAYVHSGIPSYKDMGPIGLGPHPYDLINLDDPLKSLISKYSHSGTKATTYDLGGWVCVC